jgi:hypothetical protein
MRTDSPRHARFGTPAVIYGFHLFEELSGCLPWFAPPLDSPSRSAAD